MKLAYFKYVLAYIPPITVFLSLYFGGYMSFFAPVFIFVFVPLVELFTQGSNENMNKEEEESAKNNPLFDVFLYSMVPIQYAFFIYFLFRINEGSLALWEKMGIMLSFGMTCGELGINAAHELGHRSTWYEQLMSKMLLLTSLYMHFFIEHNRGHHKNVSTDEDPASSKYGENLYAFFIRSVRDGWLSAWKLEQKRLERANQPFVSLQNEMLRFQMIQILLLVAILVIWNWQSMLFFIGSATIGFLLLETVNYIEHYGLRRKRVDDKYYERTMPIHSWNSNHPLGRIFLFELTRHSDHHYMANRKYQVLRHFDESPQMPTGYPGMMVLAFFPPLWFKVMHQQIEKYKATKEGLALG